MTFFIYKKILIIWQIRILREDYSICKTNAIKAVKIVLIISCQLNTPNVKIMPLKTTKAISKMASFFNCTLLTNIMSICVIKQITRVISDRT